MNDRLTFNSTPYANATIVNKLKDLGFNIGGSEISIGDIILTLQLNFDITIYILNPSEKNNDFVFMCVDNIINTCFYTHTVKNKLTVIILNLILFKTCIWLLWRNKINEINDVNQKYKFDSKSIELLKEYVNK